MFICVTKLVPLESVTDCGVNNSSDLFPLWNKYLCSVNKTVFVAKRQLVDPTKQIARRNKVENIYISSVFISRICIIPLCPERECKVKEILRSRGLATFQLKSNLAPSLFSVSRSRSLYQTNARRGTLTAPTHPRNVFNFEILMLIPRKSKRFEIS